MNFFPNRNHKDFKIGKAFYLLRYNGGFWFRFFGGYGLHGKNFKKNQLLFTDRYHLEKRVVIGNWIFKILKS